MNIKVLLFSFFLVPLLMVAQEEEDYSMYDDLEYADEEATTFASPKIIGLSPNRFINVAWDVQSPYTLESSEIKGYAPDYQWEISESGNVSYTGGLRLNANIPVVSRNNIVWQMGANYMNTNFSIDEPDSSKDPILFELDKRALKTTGLFTTVFKPLNDKQFLIFQGQADYNGNYTFTDFHSFGLTKYSAAVLWGKRPHDRLQWAIGASRTYRVGELNYVPIIMYNWTSKKEKWGTEILFPAKANGKYWMNKNSLIMFGYELEGGSYHLEGLSNNGNSFELRRGAVRPRIEWNRKLVGFFWLNAQLGARINYGFTYDELKDGKEFFRGFLGQQEIAAFSSLGTSIYGLVGISFVSL
jgi:hypothetical protein